MSAEPVDLTDGSFDAEVLEAAGPVLVLFWAEWSGHCRMMLPVVADAVDTYAGRMTVGRLNIDHQTQTRDRFELEGIPTLLLFRDGAVVAKRIGPISQGQFTEFVDANL